MPIRRCLLPLMLFLSISCASSPTTDSGIEPRLDLVPLARPSDVFYFPGPVSLDFDLTVTNPANVPITLERLNLQTYGFSGVRLRADGQLRRTIPAQSSSTIRISTWGQSRGGLLGASEPVDLHATAYFTSPKGRFTRVFNEHLTGPGT